MTARAREALAEVLGVRIDDNNAAAYAPSAERLEAVLRRVEREAYERAKWSAIVTIVSCAANPPTTEDEIAERYQMAAIAMTVRDTMEPASDAAISNTREWLDAMKALGGLEDGDDGFPLCDGCAPEPGDREDVAAVAERLRTLPRAASGTVVAKLGFASNEYVAGVLAESDRLRTALAAAETRAANAERERDEARAGLRAVIAATFRGSPESDLLLATPAEAASEIANLHDYAAHAEAERDEARAQLDRWSSTFERGQAAVRECAVTNANAAHRKIAEMSDELIPLRAERAAAEERGRWQAVCEHMAAQAEASARLYGSPPPASRQQAVDAFLDYAAQLRRWAEEG